MASSSSAVAAARAAGSAAMAALSEGRFPAPVLRVVTEHSSGARYLKVRLLKSFRMLSHCVCLRLRVHPRRSSPVLRSCPCVFPRAP